MPTTTPLTDAINALTTYSNTVTGASDTTLSEAVATLASGYGGGSMGGLSNMVDVNTQDYEFAYMLMCMKKGDTAGGTVTYSEAFPDTETKILETGLTTVHGLAFINPDISISTSGDAGLNKVVFIFVTSSDTLNVIGIGSGSSNVTRVFGQAQGVVQTAAPLNGAIRINGGDIYYAGRYNKNASYQLLKVNTQYEWLAW